VLSFVCTSFKGIHLFNYIPGELLFSSHPLTQEIFEMDILKVREMYVETPPSTTILPPIFYQNNSPTPMPFPKQLSPREANGFHHCKTQFAVYRHRYTNPPST
jgi:hypothetical protein